MLAYVGFEFIDGCYKEHLPKSKQVSTKEQGRSLFISMYNYYMPKELRFEKYEFNPKQTLLQNLTCKANLLSCTTVEIKRWKNFLSSDQVLFSVDDMFSNLVYERIKKVNRGKPVKLLDDGICIDEKEGSTLVIPCFTEMNIKDIYMYKEMSKVKKNIQNKKYNQVYLVYPKTDEFKRHIELKLPELKINEDEYRVKVIPYSFSFCLKNRTKGRCKC